jgi:outer membrane protein assembly factor BamA
MRVVFVMTWVLILAGCSPIKYVPEEQYLTNRIKIRNTTRELSKGELNSYLRQKENLKILGIWKFHLGLYNLSGRDSSKWYNRTLKKIGEEPVLFDAQQSEQSRDQLEKYLKNKGYFLARVTDTVILKGKQRVNIEFSLFPSVNYKINHLAYRVEDEKLTPLVLADTSNAIIKRNKPFDAELHDQERERITSRLRNKGYYAFSKDYIYFKADSTIGNHRVNDTLVIMPPLRPIDNSMVHEGNHKQYKYKEVYYIIGETPQKAFVDNKDATEKFDTLVFRGCHFLYHKNIDVHPMVLLESSYIVPGEIYNASQVDRTRLLLTSLSVFRYIDIRFRNAEPTTLNDDYNYLDCYVQLVPSKKQAFSVQIEGTNASGNLGAGANLKYQHRNLFRGAELFNAGLRVSQERQFVRGTSDEFNTTEFGTEVGIESPKFIAPFISEGFRKRHSPRTSLQMAYNYQNRPDYTRTIANLRLGYNWRDSKYVSHYLYPSELSMVQLPYIHPDFWDDIDSTFLRYSYEDHFILNSSYSIIFNTQAKIKQPEYFFSRFNVELAGNLLNLLVPIWQEPVDDYYNVMDIRFAQYAKADIDSRYFYSLDKYNAIAYRLFAGVAYPYGNLKVMPFEKKYYSGGANGIRAWPVRGLGPGIFRDTTSTFYNQTADIKLEMNLEYRFRLLWKTEGALFLDAGNIWAIRPEASPPGGMFELDKFFRQIAIGTGVGFRVDFSYFLFRLDLGIKAYDPTYPGGPKWVLGNDALHWDEMALNFAIGYPF